MADDWGKFPSINRRGYSPICHLSLSPDIDDDNFDPDAGFQQESEWAGEDEGLDTEVSPLILGRHHGYHLSSCIMMSVFISHTLPLIYA